MDQVTKNTNCYGRIISILCNLLNSFWVPTMGDFGKLPFLLPFTKFYIQNVIHNSVFSGNAKGITKAGCLIYRHFNVKHQGVCHYFRNLNDGHLLVNSTNILLSVGALTFIYV